MKVTKKQMKEQILPNYNLLGIYTIRDIEYRTKGHWFSASAKRFFNSKIYGEVFCGKTKAFFVSSEKFSDSTNRLFSVRCFNPKDGSIETVGEFQSYATKTQALTAALSFAANDK